MFGIDLSGINRLLEKVLSELQTSNKTQKELLAAINENTKATKLLASQALAKPEQQTEGNHYLGDGSSSHKGGCKSKKEGAGDCRSKCNGRCDNEGTSTSGKCG